MVNSMLSHDIVVVGAGLAGMRAAVEATLRKADVAVISKVHPMRSHSVAAQGGINAPLGEKDSVDAHTFDTVKGSDYLADQDAAEILCREAPGIIFEMEHWGTIFSRTEEGRLAQRPFGGAGFPRTCFSADRTGLVLMQTCYERILEGRVTVYEEWFATSLVVENDECKGLVALNMKTGQLEAIRAKAVILATGGAGRIYAKTTNSYTSTGDGMALAYRAGAPLKDLEFIQFHPTSLYGCNILVTEGARAEGGYLRNKDGERFMKKYAPEKMELAPRDIVARAEQTEINEGRGVGPGYILLDLTHLGEAKIQERLPEIRSLAKDFAGVDPVKEPIPIEPAQHYTMGGVSTDVNGASPIRGLYAAGECACVSVHGANRLGGNSILDCLVFGKRTGAAAAEYVKGKALPDFPKDAVKKDQEKIDAILRREKGEKASTIKAEMGKTMTENVGIFRTGERLSLALQKIRELKKRYENIVVDDKSTVYNTDLIAALELGYMLDVAEVIVAGAIARTESRGAHARLDYPKRDDQNWLRHTLAYYTPEGPMLDYKPVVITKYQPVERKY